MPMAPKMTDDWISRTGMSPTMSCESWGTPVPIAAAIAPYTPATTQADSASHPSGRSTSPSARRWHERGAMALKAATLHAVNVPARPETNAKAIAAPVPPIASALASR